MAVAGRRQQQVVSLATSCSLTHMHNPQIEKATHFHLCSLWQSQRFSEILCINSGQQIAPVWVCKQQVARDTTATNLHLPPHCFFCLLGTCANRSIFLFHLLTPFLQCLQTPQGQSPSPAPPSVWETEASLLKTPGKAD